MERIDLAKKEQNTLFSLRSENWLNALFTCKNPSDTKETNENTEKKRLED